MVDFESLADLRAAGEAFVESQPNPVVIDLAGLQECNSAAVALLLSWFRYAHARDKTIVYTHAAADLVNIVRVSGLQEILPLDSGAHA
jgi:ABC-type transporter Mla MlaB component